MEIKSAINIILKDLEEARALIDGLKSYPGVPLLQVELAKAKCLSAENVIKLLSEMPDNYFITPEKEIGGQEIEIEIDVEPDNDSAPEDTDTVELPVTAENKEKVSRVVDEIVHNKINYPSETPNSKGKKIVADNFSRPSDSINEKIGDSKKDEMSTGKHSKPVTDLVKAIGINDRFLFIREIFEGNQEAYNSAIGKLNDVKSIDEAIDIISSSGSGSNEEAIGLLIELVKRKISTSGNG